MTRIGKIALAFFMGIALTPLVAAAQTVPLGKNGDVELSNAARIGTVDLQPGHYRLQHVTTDGQHFLIVKSQPETRRGGMHYASGPGKEIARIPCQVVTLDKKVKATELHTRKQPDGTTVITQIRIRSEGAGHLIALEPTGGA